jgi:hypothetical protein
MVLQLDPGEDDAAERIITELERRSEAAILRAFRAQWQNLLPPNAETMELNELMSYINSRLLESQPAVDAIARTLYDAAGAGVNMALDELERIGIGFDYTLVNTRAQEWARRYSGELITNINDTTKQAVQQAVERWYGNGEQLSALVDDLQPTFSKRRAKLIAQTETTRSAAEGSRAGRVVDIGNEFAAVTFGPVLCARVDERVVKADADAFQLVKRDIDTGAGRIVERAGNGILRGLRCEQAAVDVVHQFAQLHIFSVGRQQVAPLFAECPQDCGFAAPFQFGDDALSGIVFAWVELQLQRLDCQPAITGKPPSHPRERGVLRVCLLAGIYAHVAGNVEYIVCAQVHTAELQRVSFVAPVAQPAPQRLYFLLPPRFPLPPFGLHLPHVGRVLRIVLFLLVSAICQYIFTSLMYLYEGSLTSFMLVKAERLTSAPGAAA